MKRWKLEGLVGTVLTLSVALPAIAYAALHTYYGTACIPQANCSNCFAGTGANHPNCPDPMVKASTSTMCRLFKGTTVEPVLKLCVKSSSDMNTCRYDGDYQGGTCEDSKIWECRCAIQPPTPPGMRSATRVLLRMLHVRSDVRNHRDTPHWYPQ